MEPMNDTFENSSIVKSVAKAVAAIVIVAACVVAIVFAFMKLTPQVASQGTVSLKHAIVQSANQCYAIEGSYPYNLEYLEKNYGLVVNHDDYSITYEVFADNVAPSVVVVEK